MPVHPPLVISEYDIFREFSTMRIKHPHQEAAVAMFEKLRRRKVEAPDAQQTATSLFAGSGSGKSTTVLWYIETIIVEECIRQGLLKDNAPRKVLRELQTLALHVELSGSTTTTGLMSDFLKALGDPDPFGGTTMSKRFRVEKIRNGPIATAGNMA
ncbi:hypothetical protein QA646_08640 [Rhizobium sp. CB3090]|uniref:hypothetical protein n=1 Tax=Rhizobium sp. CB3090 TaxID=3039156 RepID=UPI0024B06A68|nr:hypothetical protein [Rhizobium sp. CB3090]WFU10889.1 hypothetical protein QA646_08640 [Rhizobium sp. CB3090]